MQPTSADLACPVAIVSPDVAPPIDVSTTVLLQNTTLASVHVPEQVTSSSTSSAAACITQTKTYQRAPRSQRSHCKCVAINAAYVQYDSAP